MNIIFTNQTGMTAASVYSNSKLAPEDTFQSASSIDPIRTPGVLRIGWTAGTDFQNVSAISNPILKVVNYFVPTASPSNYALGIEQGPKVHQINTVTQAVTNSGNFPHTTTASGIHAAHTALTGEDITIFKENNVDKVLYTWNDATDGDIGMMAVDGSGSNDNYFSMNSPGGVPLGRFPHPIIRGDNGFYYVADGNAIHKIDGSTAPAVITLDAIDLPPGWIIYDILNFRGTAWILARQQFNYSPSQSTGLATFDTAVFQWNYISNRAADFSGFSYGSPHYLEYSAEGSTANIGRLFLLGNVVHVMTYTVTGRTQIRSYTGSDFVPIDEIAGNQLPTRGGIVGYKGQIAWLSTTGTVCTFGSISPDFPLRHNFIGSFAGNCGFLAVDFGGNYFASYNSTHVASMSGIATSASLTTFVKEIPRFAVPVGLWIFFRSITDATNSNLTLNFYRNYSSTPVTGTYQLTHVKDGPVGWKYFKLGGKNFVNTQAIRLALNWSLTANATDTIEPYRIEVECATPPKVK